MIKIVKQNNWLTTKKPGKWLKSASECASFKAYGPREWTVERTEWRVTITKPPRKKDEISLCIHSPHFHRVRYSLVLVWQLIGIWFTFTWILFYVFGRCRLPHRLVLSFGFLYGWLLTSHLIFNGTGTRALNSVHLSWALNSICFNELYASAA